MKALRTMDPRTRAAVLALIAIVGFIAVRKLRSGGASGVDTSALPVEPGLTGAAALGGGGGGGAGFGGPIVLRSASADDANAGLTLLGYAPDGTPVYGMAPSTATTTVGGAQTSGAAGVEPAAAPGNAAVVAAISDPAAPTVTYNAPAAAAPISQTFPTDDRYTAPVPVALVTAHPDAFAPDQPTYAPADVALAVPDRTAIAVGSTRDPNVYLQLGRKLEINP